MTLSLETTLELMALADGELHGDARERAEKLMAQSEEAQRVVAAMRSSGPALQSWLADTFGRQSQSADGIADAVMAKLAGGAASTVAGGPIAHLVPAVRAPRARVVTRVALAASVLAFAALAVLYIRSMGVRSGQQLARVAAAGASGVAIGAPRAAEEPAQRGRGVEVEEIDSAKRVSIFEISGATASAQSVVVWIDDDQEER